MRYEKKVLALLLGGVMAAGSLFMQTPATVQASDEVVDDLKSDGWKAWAESKDYCSGLSDAHIKSSAVSSVNGYLTVTLQVEFPDKPNGADYGYGGAVYVCEEQWQPTADISGGDAGYYDYMQYLQMEADDPDFHATKKKYFSECDGGNYDGEGAFTLTFDGLTSGKTYYVYCYVYDTHGWGEEGTYGLHWAVCLGSGIPTASAGSSSGSSSSDNSSSADSSSDNTSSGSSTSGSNSETEAVSYEDEITGQIEEAPSGSTVVMEKGVTALSNAIMKELLEKGDVSLKMEFTYQDKEYVIIIPAGAALDNDIPWYGPLYLAQHFGNKAGTAAAGEGGSYEVQLGDSLSKIAAKSHMTLKQLLEKNPQIKDPDKIMVGQKINQ